MSPTTHHGQTAQPTGPHLSTDSVWTELDKASFAVLSYISPTGKPRSSGVIYAATNRRIFISTAPDSFKATQISNGDEVAITVTVRRGGLLSLVAPIPPGTISFHATATVHPPGTVNLDAVSHTLATRLPPDNRTSGCLLELTPAGDFLTYGIGVSLRDMARPKASLAHVPVG